MEVILYDKYVLNNNGVIKNIISGNIIHPEVMGNGYLRVSLYHDSIKTRHMLHILVAQNFIPNPNNLPQVNHKDGDKTNCNDWNLEWCTQSYNIKHAIANGLYTKQSINQEKASIASANKHSIEVHQFSKDGVYINTFKNKHEASKQVNGTTPNNIRACCVGSRHTCGGYRWSYTKGDDLYE